MNNKKKICIAVSTATILTFLLWLVIDVILNGTIREYTYKLLYEKFSYGWESLRLFLYASFLLLIFSFIVIYFIIPSVLRKKIKKAEQNKIKNYISYFLTNSEIPEIDDEYKELKDILLKLRIKSLEEENKKNEMISNIAHDLRTPLTSISGYLMLLNDEEDLPLSIRKKYTNICVEKSEQLNKLINEFFELTQISLGEIPLNYSEINLTQLIEQLADEFYPITEAKGLSIEFEYTKAVTIKADGNKIGRAFENIIRNAVNYIYNSSTIKISHKISQDKVTIYFSNKTSPISEPQLKRIFERSYRIDDSRNSGGYGGIGLPIAKEIIEAHNGNISFNYKNDVITFVIELPCN